MQKVEFAMSYSAQDALARMARAERTTPSHFLARMIAREAERRIEGAPATALSVHRDGLGQSLRNALARVMRT